MPTTKIYNNGTKEQAMVEDQALKKGYFFRHNVKKKRGQKQ